MEAEDYERLTDSATTAIRALESWGLFPVTVAFGRSEREPWSSRYSIFEAYGHSFLLMMGLHVLSTV